MILVINGEASAGLELKSMIEFMDTPRVVTASPLDWRESIGEERLDAVFLGADLDDQEVDMMLDELGHIDPNVSIVMVDSRAGA